MTLRCPRCGLSGGVDLYDAESRKKLDLQVRTLDLPERTRNCLWKIEYVGELIQQSESELLKISGLGRRGLADVKETVAELGFRLGTYIEGWRPPGTDAALRAKLNLTLLDFDVTVRSLPIRVHTALQAAGIDYVGELVQKPEIELRKLRNFGRITLKALKEALAEVDLQLGMHLTNWTRPTPGKPW